MNEYSQLLSPSEKIYYPVESQLDTMQTHRVEAAETMCIGVMTAHMQRPAKRVNPNLGRKKMLPEDLAINQEARNSKKSAERILAEQDRIFRANQKAEKLAAAQKKLKEIKDDQERLQQLQNKKQVEPGDEEAMQFEFANYPLITSGLLAIPGKTGVMINSKTTIYVKHGRSIPDAIKKHLVERKVASIF
ncbi:hypothetical protein [Mucilaginibacter sp.]|uniref:hypothetical protein n=1 Tax=Mucilaginibacter sp. TaxID=1882438 RepID=UPI002606D948|nr:hypothetical protein [Mucilaginibacter sp.]MDB4920776.1 hypothetical protein [Mucilaginibacter sp.]